MNKITHTRSEIARLGDELFDRVVAPGTTPDQDRLFVAIDVDSGAFEIDADELSAARRVRAGNPDAQIWLRRVGVPYLHRFSPRFRSRPERPS
ncbi:MAG TPA: hypothetical protein VLK84_18655 [Longimicrobium sp.]|nr:hypothetical protein [Longimicrobium sp.]